MKIIHLNCKALIYIHKFTYKMSNLFEESLNLLYLAEYDVQGNPFCQNNQLSTIKQVK
jgi:hypothetical protein